MTQLELYDKLYKKIIRDYPSANISIVDVSKRNEKYKGFQVSFDRDKLSPVFNLDKLVEDIRNEEDFEEIADIISKEIKNAVVFSEVDLSLLDDYEKLKYCLCIDVISTKENEYYLSTVPYKQFGRDMAIVPKAVLANSLDAKRFPIVAIDNKMIEQLGVSGEKICEDAIKNASKINPSLIIYIQDFLYREDYNETPWTNLQDNSSIPVRILLTETGIHPASALLNSAALQDLANRLNDDFYLIPTNNGALAAPVGHEKAKDIMKVIQDVLNKEGLVNGMRAIGEMQRYDKENKLLEPNEVYEERMSKVREEIEKQEKDVDLDSDKGEKEKEKIKDGSISR